MMVSSPSTTTTIDRQLTRPPRVPISVKPRARRSPEGGGEEGIGVEEADAEGHLATGIDSWEIGNLEASR